MTTPCRSKLRENVRIIQILYISHVKNRTDAADPRNYLCDLHNVLQLSDVRQIKGECAGAVRSTTFSWFTENPWSERPTGPCPAAWDWPVRPIEKTQHAVFRYLWSNKYQYQATGLWSVRRPEQGLSVGKEGIIEGVATSVRELQARRCLLGLPSPWPEHPTDSSPASWHWPQCPIEKTQNATCFVMCNRAWYQATGPVSYTHLTLPTIYSV